MAGEQIPGVFVDVRMGVGHHEARSCSVIERERKMMMERGETLAFLEWLKRHGIPDTEHGGDAWLVGEVAYRIGAARRLNAAGQVKWVIGRAEAWERLFQLVCGCWRKRRHSEAIRLRGVGCDFADAS